MFYRMAKMIEFVLRDLKSQLKEIWLLYLTEVLQSSGAMSNNFRVRSFSTPTAMYCACLSDVCRMSVACQSHVSRMSVEGAIDNINVFSSFSFGIFFTVSRCVMASHSLTASHRLKRNHTVSLCERRRICVEAFYLRRNSIDSFKPRQVCEMTVLNIWTYFTRSFTRPTK